MMARNPQNAEFYHDEGTRLISKADDMIEEGRVGASIKPWVERARVNFEELNARIQASKIETEEESDPGVTEQAQEPEDVEDEETATGSTHKRDDDEESVPSLVFTGSKYASTISGKYFRNTLWLSSANSNMYTYTLTRYQRRYPSLSCRPSLYRRWTCRDH